MKNKELLNAFDYQFSRIDHFNKLSLNAGLLHNILFIIILIFLLPFFIFFKIFLKFIIKKKIGNKKINTLCLVYTTNQLKIAKFLEKSNDFKLITFELDYKNNFSRKDLTISLLSDYSLVNNCIQILKTPYFRKNLFRVLKTIAIGNIQKKILKASKPKVLLQFNDHSPVNFNAFNLSIKNKIYSVYIQHAPVSSLFPPLYHNLNILFSKDSLDKYRIKNNKIQVDLAFDFRFSDGLKYINKPKIKNSVLVCPNLLDDIKEVEKTVKLLEDNNYNVRVRMHPGDKRKLCKEIKTSKIKNIWKDLSDVEFVVTNESAIPLEAIFMKCFVYKASYWSKPIDGYGFIKNGLLLFEENSAEQCLESITENKQQFNEKKLKHYIGNITNSKQEYKLNL